MSTQQMTFRLAYGGTQGNAKCKSCQGAVAADSPTVGVKSDSMYDPMWYHFRCFWSRCPYRKQMSRHLEDYADLAGFATLTAEDKSAFRDSLQELAETYSNGPGLKRRSVSEDNLIDLERKRRKPEVVSSLPKLSLSATGFLSRSAVNLAATRQSRAANAGSGAERELVVCDHVSVTVTGVGQSTDREREVLISTRDEVNNTSSTLTFNERQWRKLASVFPDITEAAASIQDSQEQDFPLLDSQAARVVSHSDGPVNVRLTDALATTEHKIKAEGQGQANGILTLTLVQWLQLTKRAGDIDSALQSQCG